MDHIANGELQDGLRELAGARDRWRWRYLEARRQLDELGWRDFASLFLVVIMASMFGFVIGILLAERQSGSLFDAICRGGIR